MRAALIAALLLVAAARADRPSLSEADAPKVVFPESTGAVRRTLELSDDELAQVAKALGRKVELRQYPYLEVRQGDGVVGWVLVLEVMAQTYPITFAVGVGVDQSVRDVAVMVYREPRGGEIQERRFRAQFKGKKLSDPLQLGRDVDAISGATISSRSAAYAAKKALALSAVLAARPK